MICSVGGNRTSHGNSRDRIAGSALFRNFCFIFISSTLQSLSDRLQTQLSLAAFCFNTLRLLPEKAVFGSLLSGFGSSAEI